MFSFREGFGCVRVWGPHVVLCFLDVFVVFLLFFRILGVCALSVLFGCE